MSTTNSYENLEYLSNGHIPPKIPVMSILGDNLRRLRQEHAPPLTQAQVADRLGILPHNYTPYETGKKLPADKTLEELASILDADYNLLLSWKEADEMKTKFSPEAQWTYTEDYLAGLPPEKIESLLKKLKPVQ